MTVDEIPIWLDCDPGHDDAVAMLLACFLPAFKLVGLSTCHGNAPPEKTDYNARSLLTAFGKADVPVYRGAQRPWVRSPHYAPDIHGETGLDGTSLLPTPTFEARDDVSYIDAIERAVMKYEGELSFISTGSMTSIATVLKERPHLIKKIKYISIMGGGFGVGNVNKGLSAEFNVWVDPHASQYLFRTPEIAHKIILTPLNLTHKAIATDEITEHVLGTGKSNIRRLFYDLFLFFKKTYKSAQGFENGPPIHDPLTLLPLLGFYQWETQQKINFTYRRLDLDVDVDCNSDHAGKLVILNEYPIEERNKGIMVGFELNFDFFWEELYHALDEAQKTSTIG
ncbi:Uridine nucleosidase [Nakaseomyces bracarensis]|uniref:Uridine nucleosidase n=1 Tax=Nakaseomyces bracarensis TaxID=273131 RepID=A0ABR4NU25_9SACH